MRYIKDLREYLKTLDELGELQEINEVVDWNLEIGAIIRRAYDLRAPAPLFNKIKDIEQGFRVLIRPHGLTKPLGTTGFIPKRELRSFGSYLLSHLYRVALLIP
jgi:UbiD family decarboxylase